MDLIRRNTDYALRAAINLAKNKNKGPISTREVARQEGIPYELACKIMQQLKKKKIVKSVMGAKGGFELKRRPSKISLLDVIESIQGQVSLNHCLVNILSCPKKSNCPVRKNLAQLQRYLNNSLSRIKISSLANI